MPHLSVDKQLLNFAVLVLVLDFLVKNKLKTCSLKELLECVIIPILTVIVNNQNDSEQNRIVQRRNNQNEANINNNAAVDVHHGANDEVPQQNEQNVPPNNINPVYDNNNIN